MQNDKKTKICYFGIYDRDLARNKVYIDGLKQNNAEIIECFDDSPGLIKFYRLFFKHWKIRKAYDVMIVGYAGHILMPFAKLICRKPIILNAMTSLHEVTVIARKKNSGLAAWRILLIDWLAFRLADLSLVETNRQKEYLVKKFRIKPDKFIRLFIGADDSIFYPDGSVEKNNKFTVMFRGKFLPEAGVRHVISAAKILEKEEIKFIIRGRGPLEKEIEEQIKILDLKNIELISAKLETDELRRKMLTAHVSIGQMEDDERLERTIPYKAFEALALKLPYISGDAPGAKELFKDRENCLMVNLADPKDLADKILELKNNPELRKKIAENGYELYKKRLTPKALGKELLDIYLYLIKK